MTFYDKNMGEIERTKKHLFLKLQEQENVDCTNKIDNIEMVTTVDQDTTLAVTIKDSTFRLNSFYSPTHEAMRWAKQYDLSNNTVISMFGLGNGKFAKQLLKRLNGNGSVLIYEPCIEVFFFCLEYYDLTDVLSAPNVFIILEGINDDEIIKLLRERVNLFNVRSQSTCFHPIYDRMFGESARKFNDLIKRNNNRIIVNKNTDMALSHTLVLNTLKNFRFIKKNNIITDLENKFKKDVPAIIVSAGPSLDKNIKELEDAKGKAIIFAVDTAVKYLLNYDIIPDAIVTLDPKKSLSHLEDERCREIPLFSRVDSRHENINKNNKRIIFYNIEGYIKKIYNKLGKETGVVRTGGSVATGAFTICEALGFDRIILVGQDLAYLGSSTHSGNVERDISKAYKNTELVEDVSGNTIKTRYDWYIYLQWFEEAVKSFSGIEVIDASEGGAKIHGTTIMNLKDAIEKYCLYEIDCDTIISGLEPTLDKSDISQLIKYITEDVKNMEYIKEKSEEAIEISNRLISKYEKSIYDTTSSIQKNQLLSAYSNCMKSMDVYELIDWDIATHVANEVSQLDIDSKDEKQNKIGNYKRASIIYNAIHKSASEILPLLMNALDEMIKED